MKHDHLAIAPLIGLNYELVKVGQNIDRWKLGG